MTDKAVLYNKIKKRLKPQSRQQCPNAPGNLAVYVVRTDTKKPVANAQIKASGPTPGNGATDAEGWVILKDRTPGSYQADITLPAALAKFHLDHGTQSGAVAACDTEILEFEATPPPKVGVALSFHPVLFVKHKFPASRDEFSVLSTPEFDGCELLADGESEAVIRIHLVKLNAAGKMAGHQIEPATAAEHYDEGNVVLELAQDDYGSLKYGGKSAKRIEVPVKDISSGLSPPDKAKGIVFTTSRKIGKAKLTASISGSAQYEYVKSFALPRGAAEHAELQLGSRNVAKDTRGYDAMKAQWFLRKAGFLVYKEQRLNKDNAACEWDDVKDIDVDGDFGAGSARCLRDFQRVARGTFRSQAVPNVAATLKDAVSEQVTPGVIGEMLEWRNKGYAVEPYNGYAHLKVTEGTALDQEARIVYGALVVFDGNDAKGYVEIKNPIGTTVCHWEGRDLVVADQIRSGIKLFEKETLKFRLHDADPKGLLDDENLNSTFATRLKTTIRTLRGEQKADSSGADARDVRLHDAHRTVQQQNDLYAKGRYRWTDADGKSHVDTDPPAADSGATGLQSTPGEPCKHGTEVRAVGTCTTHPIGKWVTRATGSSMSSWHQFGLAVDLVFSNDRGNAVWGDEKNWTHNGDVAKGNSLTWGGDWQDEDLPHIQLPSQDSPGQDHKDKYNTTAGTVKQKLQAVWAMIP